MATTPAFASTPRIAVGQVSAANTARDGTGTIVTIFTAGSSGSRVENIRLVATGTTTAGVVRLFIHDGSNARLFWEELVSAITPSTTVKVWSTALDFSTNGAVILLPNGYSIRAATHNAETFNVFVVGGDF